jgi:FAD/FMN-containing dehydrogenase
LLFQQDPVIDDDDHVQTMRHELFPNQDIELFVPESLLRAADDWLKHIISAFADSDYVVPQNIVDSVRQAGLSAAFTRGSYTHHAPIFYQRVLRDETLISMTAGAGAGDAYYSIIVLSYLPPEPEGGGFEKFAKFVGEGLVRLFNARAHWGKYFPLGVGDLERRYDPNLPKFRKICDEYDPNGVFRNEFTARALGLAKPSNNFNIAK